MTLKDPEASFEECVRWGIHLHLHVAEDEFGRIGIVGVNAVDLCCGKEDIFGTL
jgi:hypothetical protein